MSAEAFEASLRSGATIGESGARAGGNDAKPSFRLRAGTPAWDGVVAAPTCRQVACDALRPGDKWPRQGNAEEFMGGIIDRSGAHVPYSPVPDRLARLSGAPGWTGKDCVTPWRRPSRPQARGGRAAGGRLRHQFDPWIAQCVPLVGRSIPAIAAHQGEEAIRRREHDIEPSGGLIRGRHHRALTQLAIDQHDE